MKIVNIGRERNITMRRGSIAFAFCPYAVFQCSQKPANIALRLRNHLVPVAASTRSLNCLVDFIFIFAFLSCLTARRGRPVPPTSLALWTGGGARRPAEPWLKSWGRSRSGTSPESHTPQYSSQDFALGVDMENTGIAVSPFIFRAKKFLPPAPRLEPPRRFPHDREGHPDPIPKKHSHS